MSCRGYHVALLVALSWFFPGILFAYEQEVNALSSKLADDIEAMGKKTIAVIDFVDLNGNVTELGRFLAEEISVALAGSRRGFEVIDRTHLRVILAENKLSSTGLIDPSTAMRLGEITGVEALVTGTITPFGDTIRVAVKILDSKTARIVGSFRGNIAKTEAIEMLLDSAINSSQDPSVLPEPSRPPKPRADSLQVREGFTFELERCQIRGRSVACFLYVTNNAEDRDLRIYGSGYTSGSRLITDRGIEFRANKTAIGGRESKSASASLVSGIRTQVVVYFEDLSSAPRSIALLQLLCSGFDVQFRNISLDR